MSIKKHKTTSLGRAHGHNERLHETHSQLPKEAWFSAKAARVVQPWDEALHAKAMELVKRKDAVVGIELVIQLGNQADWRDDPTAEHPHGKPKAKLPANGKQLREAVMAAAAGEFGKQNVLSCTLHWDESTPHAHLVVAPIKDGKLQAKAWVGGAAKCATLRERIHKRINAVIPCSYTKGAPGGEPHDPRKAAGRQPPKNLLDRALDVVGMRKELDGLKADVKALKADRQQAFSKIKRIELARAKAEERAKKAEAEAKDAAVKAKRETESAMRAGKRELDWLKGDIAKVTGERDQLRERVEQLSDENSKLARTVETLKNPPKLRLVGDT